MTATSPEPEVSRTSSPMREPEHTPLAGRLQGDAELAARVAEAWELRDTPYAYDAAAAIVDWHDRNQDLERLLRDTNRGREQRGAEPTEGAFKVVTIDEFVAVDEPGAGALVGETDDALIPENGDIMVYGDGGAGKTTVCVDLACHLAAGDDWLGIRVGRPARVLLVESEGPRPLFRRKLRRKRQAWDGSTLDDRLLVFEEPWARFTFDRRGYREALADTIRELEVDVVIVGPVTRSGMNEAGTLQEVRDFMGLVGELRSLAGRRVAIVLIHHEGKGGKVSGAWEGSGDTLLHVQGQGHGRTRLYVQKARWDSTRHGTSLQLLWTDGEGFAVDDKPELDDEQLGEKILGVIRGNPGTSWTKVEEATPGVSRDRRRTVRDGLFAAGEILNIVKEDGTDVAITECPERRPARLHPATDPTISHLRPERGAAAAQTAPVLGAKGRSASAPCAPPLRGRTGVGADHAPSDNPSGAQLNEIDRLVDEGLL